MSGNAKSSASSSYNDLSQRLDATIDKLQDPNLDIDDAVKCYEEAVGIIEQLEQHLERSQNEVRTLKSRFGQGD